MERLTGRGYTGKAIIKRKNLCGLSTDLACYDSKEALDLLQKAFDKLAEYEDAEEQGMLLRSPCKVGDKVWAITTYSLDAYAYEVPLKYPQEKKIQSITVTSDDVLYHVKNRTYSVCNFGKTVFLTKEEAEQALKQMGE